MLVLSYLGFLAVVPLVVEKDDREIQWHAKHGLVLFVAEVIFFAAVGIITSIMPGCLGSLGCLVSWILMVPVLVLHIMAIMKALNGEKLIIPGVSQYVDRF